jgi:hypothetical protein
MRRTQCEQIWSAMPRERTSWNAAATSLMGQEETFISRCASCDLSPSRAPLPFYASAVV